MVIEVLKYDTGLATGQQHNHFSTGMGSNSTGEPDSCQSNLFTVWTRRHKIVDDQIRISALVYSSNKSADRNNKNV